MNDDLPVNVSRETKDRLDQLAELLTRWNPRINLVAGSTLTDLWTRHIADSLQIFDYAPPDAQHWVDMGSGGGFPGLVIAVRAMESPSALRVTMIESDQRKAAFLRTAIREIGAPATVLAKRIEDVEPLKADVVSARALAPLPTLLGYVARHLRQDGTALLPKGARWAAERDAAQDAWTFSLTTHPSKTDPKGVILQIGDLAHV